ncbi:MAG: hypothetical protein FWC50_09380 [Planctomycetaceae bacterium]|nr:hypothetical protein [Planctomycetaceae bacterium]
MSTINMSMRLIKMNRIGFCSVVVGMLLFIGTTATLLAQCWNCGATGTTVISTAPPTVISRPVTISGPVTTISGPVTRSANFPVVDPVPTRTFRIENETQFREEEETSFQQVWDREVRERRFSVIRQVPETTVQQETFRVLRPVWTTEFRDTSYNVIRTVPETSEREERVTVSRPVWETAEREVWQTVQRPVQETVMQERQMTVNRPVTTLQTNVVDRGQFVNFTFVQPGRTFNRLAWQQGGTFVDPATGATRRQLPGLFWTPMQEQSRLRQGTVFQSNLVTETTPVTTLVPETVVEQVPVTRTTFQEERIARREPYQVMRMVQEEQVRRVPVTTFRQVVERVQQTTPVQVYRMETQEVTRDVPVTRNKTVVEERTEPYTVLVPRIQPVTRKVLRPFVVERRIPLDESGQPMLLPETNSPSVVPPSVVSPSIVSPTSSIETPAGTGLSPASEIQASERPAVGGVDKTYVDKTYADKTYTDKPYTDKTYDGKDVGDPASTRPALPNDSQKNGINLAK